MDMILTLALRELRLQPRRKHLRLKRAGLLIACSGVLLFPYLGSIIEQNHLLGLALFEVLFPLAVLISLITAPVIAGGAIGDDREAHTLELICMTPLSDWQILLGRVMGATIQSAVTLLCLMPLLILCVSLGGVSVVQVLLACALILSIIFSASCLGISVSLGIRISWPFEIISVVMSLLVIVLLPLIPMAINELPWLLLPDRIMDIAELLSLPHAIGKLLLGNQLQAILITIGYLLAIGIVLIIFSRMQLRRQIMRGWQDTDRKEAAPTRQSQNIFEGNPVQARDLHCKYRSGLGEKALITAFLTLLGFIIYSYFHDGRIPNPDDLSLVLMWFLSISMGLWLLLALWRGANAYTDEKRAGVLDMLLLTSMTPTQLEAGKRKAVFGSARPWWIVSLILSLLMVMATWYMDDWQMVPLFIFFLIYAWLTVHTAVGLAIFLSLKVGRLAFILCLVTMIGVLMVQFFGLWPISLLITMIVLVPGYLMGGQVSDGFQAIAFAVGGIVQLVILFKVGYLFRLHTIYHLELLCHSSK